MSARPILIATLLTIAGLTMSLLAPTHARAKAPVATCADAVDAADKAGQDWTTSGGADGIHYIDGKSIATMDQLRAVLIAAKQDVPFISGGDFGGWNFSNLPFAVSGACFYQSDLKASKWNGADMFSMGFIKSDLAGASFENSKIENVLLRENNLKDVNMLGANLSNGRLDGGWAGSVENWDLTGANLTGFRFECGIMIDDGCALDRNGVKFTGANLTGANISSLPFWGQADYSGAIILNTIISPRQLSDLFSANVSGAILSGGDKKVNLTSSEMELLIEQASLSELQHDRPSFDCSKAVITAEAFICAEYQGDIRRRDRHMAKLYNMIRPKFPAIAADQKAWLAKRNKCDDGECLADIYDKRIAELLTKIGDIELLPRGKSELYIADEVPFSESFRDEPLFAKITPVLVGSSMTEAIISRDANGIYSIMGASVGANAHSCSLLADGVAMDLKTGWFSADGAPIFRIIDDEMEIIGGGHPDADRYPNSGDYVGCGARAMFDIMRPIKVSPALLKAELEALAAQGS